MRVVEAGSPEEFLERAGPVLLADEARHNLALGTLATVIAHPEAFPIRRCWLVEVDGAVVGAALWTPPYNLILPRPLGDGALAALAAQIDDDLPGVTAALPEADMFATAWCRRRGVGFEVSVAQGIYALERVVPIEGVPGAMRPAGEEDRLTISNWYRAFMEEALPGGGPRDEEADARRERTIDVRLGDGASSGIVLWEDEGEVVSLAGFGGETPNGIRVGPVYTPPARRRRGYASALTAGLSARLLESGRRFCFLYTNLANPTANKIYREIGYEHVCDSAELAITPRANTSAA